MKIGIVTLNGYFNYGNRLQNYAVCRLLQKYGYSAESITVNIKEDTIKKQHGLKLVIMRILPYRFLVRLIYLKKYIKMYLRKDIELDRNRIFRKFSMFHIPQKQYYVKQYDCLKKVRKIKKYDYILVGSDQVWNPYFAGNDYYFLTFIPPRKRIGFVASIGLTKLPEEHKNRYAQLLRQMRYISVREESAVQIIEKLIQKKVDCFFDPVLLLEKEDWENMIRPAGIHLPEKYVLSFFLGKEPGERIGSFSCRHDLQVIHMNQKRYKEYYLMAPDQLLFMIKNATVIMTDSFHVMAFSIIFQKQFYVFRRKEEKAYLEDMFSRMENLLGRLHLTDRIQNDGYIEDKEDITMERYILVDEKLKEERDSLGKTMRNVLKKK